MKKNNKSLENLRIFLCHASSDKMTVREIYNRLCNIEGVDTWFDEAKLKGGQDWELEIHAAVRNSHVVIICLSKGSITKAGFIQKEIKFALDVADEQPEGTIFLIPLKLEPCEVTDRLKRWQWIDFYNKEGYGKLLDALNHKADQLGITISFAKEAEFSNLIEATPLEKIQEISSGIGQLIIKGNIIPVIGGEANLCGRPEGPDWLFSKYPPTHTELAAFLAQRFKYLENDKNILGRVSQYIVSRYGRESLYEALDEALNIKYDPTPLHQFFVWLSTFLRGRVRKRDDRAVLPIIITTNYDNGLEHAFQLAGESFELMTINQHFPQDKRFQHWRYEGEWQLVDPSIRPKDWVFTETLKKKEKSNSIIIKILGGFMMAEPKYSSYVISDDDYDDYGEVLKENFPWAFNVILRTSPFLFLNFDRKESLNRYILKFFSKITKDNKYKPWIVLWLPTTQEDKEFYIKYGAEILNVQMKEFIMILTECINDLFN